MFKLNKNYWYAVFLLVGMTMGVGMLAVPYVIQASGLLPSFGYFLILGAITLFINLSIGELILRTGGHHRVVGQVRIYLGKWPARLVAVSNSLGVWGILMAYILTGGKFLRLIASRFGGSELLYQAIFFVIFSFLILRGVRKMAQSEFWLTFIKLGLLIGFFIIYSQFIDTFNYSLADIGKLFLPYGVILFAIGGAAAVPEMCVVLDKEKKEKLKSAIMVGTSISIILIALWGLVVSGITGFDTTEEAITGLAAHFGPLTTYVGAIFGLFLVATPFLVLGENFMEQWQLDLKVKSKVLAFFLALGVPFIFLIIIHPSLLKIISVTGAIFGAFDLTLLTVSYLKCRKVTAPVSTLKIKYATLWGVLELVIFKLGALYQLYFSFFAK